jgi:EAL domain-containing protein (putative c-di-GMP-specific phosphodiesterase class I)
MEFQSLIATLNEFLERERGLPEPPLIMYRGKVEGRFGELRLTTIFHPIRRIERPEPVLGQQAYLRIYADGENPGSVLDAFAAGQDTISVINLDRLCRTIHVLNFLLLPENSADLFLHVNPRHVTGLKMNHGAYFEDVLARCGTAPNRMVITLSLGLHAGGHYRSFAQGLDNYRKRGFRIALKFTQRTSLERNGPAFLQDLRPDFLHLDGSLILAAPGGAPEADPPQFNPLIAAGHAVGAQVVAEGLETERLMALAAAAGVDLVQGNLAAPKPAGTV